MRLCEADAAAVESLHAELSSLGLADATSARALARARLAAGRPREAAAALAPLLAAPRLAAPTARLAEAVAAACAAAGLAEEAAALCSAPPLPPLEAEEEASLSATLRPAGLEEAPPRLERTLAVLKPDAVKAGLEAEITSWITQQAFEIVDIRRITLSEERARQWLQVSWGTSAGDMERRFFQEMARFYASGEIVALLLQREGAIQAWRELLGPGDPSVARKHAPATARAMWGTNKQANAAHGADSERAAQREIEFMFGEGCAVADPKLSHDSTLSDDPSPKTRVERSW
ncbi:hypothetical protein AB1Y20_015970 [Prymnesium parvum]|uniref:Nucleoside diphosphate kinase-like domain-containing protein n=1 Tax=Prymnesium parvum TaxID=97485 RepID=A0AB34JYN5_PRYPA